MFAECAERAIEGCRVHGSAGLVKECRFDSVKYAISILSVRDSSPLDLLDIFLLSGFLPERVRATPRFSEGGLLFFVLEQFPLRFGLISMSAKRNYEKSVRIEAYSKYSLYMCKPREKARPTERCEHNVDNATISEKSI